MNDDELLALVRRLPSRLEPLRELLLANLVMISEIPSPTFGEERRVEFIKQRFTECGLDTPSSDEMGNAVAVLPGEEGGRSILLSAHVDTPFAETVPHAVALTPGEATGPGVADNSLGVAVLATLPTILERLGIRLQSDLVLLGSTRSLGRGNLEGLRFYLAHRRHQPVAGISVEGAQLGRVHYASLAALGGEILLQEGEGAPRDGKGVSPGVIPALGRLIGELQARIGETGGDLSLILGMVEGGTSHKVPAQSAALRFMARSGSDRELDRARDAIESLIGAISGREGVHYRFDPFARSRAGGLADDHPLVLNARRILTALGVPPELGCCSSAVSTFLEHGVPALAIGMAHARHLNQPNETVEIDTLQKGVAQLIGILLAIDGGACD